MKKIIIGVVVIVLVVFAGRAFWAYQQMKGGDKQQITSPSGVVKKTQDTNLKPVATTTAVAQEEEVIMTGGNNAGPDCLYRENSDSEACRDLSIEYKIEVSDSVKNSSYLVGFDSQYYRTGWNNSYFVSQPLSEFKFLGHRIFLIPREIYNKIFSKNIINDKILSYNFSVHCSDDKTVLPTVNSRQCSGSDQPENEYLFNDRGERITTLADFKKNLIAEYNGYPDDVSTLETVKKLKTNTALLIDQGHVYVPITNSLQKIEVIYSGFIDGNKLMPKDKLEEISYFKDGSTTTIKK